MLNRMYLKECESTNAYLREKIKTENLDNYFVVYTDFQTAGKGQRGSSWESQRGKNLLFSVLLHTEFLKLTDQFYLTIIMSLAIIKTLNPFVNGKLEIKWPNDVYLNDNKLAGILCESVIYGNTMQKGIIGVGLNVNQSHFETKNCTSLLLEIGQITPKNDLLDSLLLNLEYYYNLLKMQKTSLIKETYYQYLRWKDENHWFEVQNTMVEGKILSVNEKGLLQVSIEGKIREFDVKDIVFVR